MKIEKIDITSFNDTTKKYLIQYYDEILTAPRRYFIPPLEDVPTVSPWWEAWHFQKNEWVVKIEDEPVKVTFALIPSVDIEFQIIPPQEVKHEAE